VALWAELKRWFSSDKSSERPVHLERGVLGENAARDFLKAAGMKFLTANFACKEGEIDLIFRDGETLVFVEVKTRTAGGWTRPSSAVDDRKRRALIRTAKEYLGLLKEAETVPYRFDVVEVLLAEGRVSNIRHNRNSFHSKMLQRRKR